METISVGPTLTVSLGRCLHSVLCFFNSWTMLELCVEQDFILKLEIWLKMRVTWERRYSCLNSQSGVNHIKFWQTVCPLPS